MRGIVLAGGTGTRLWPITKCVSKQLLPVFDKPMIFYPIATLMQAGIREILIVTTSEDQPRFKELLGTGSQFGVNFNYLIQTEPRGIAEAFIIGREFIGNGSIALVLGDNIFNGFKFEELNLKSFENGAHIFTYEVASPSAYGVLTLNSDGSIDSIVEKPSKPKSNLAITGLYFFNSEVVSKALKLSPSKRGELEIVDLIKSYHADKKLSFTQLPSGTAWLDTGTPEGLHDATSYVRIIEERTSIKIACLEEIAFRKGWIDRVKLAGSLGGRSKNSYSAYLEKLLESGR